MDACMCSPHRSYFEKLTSCLDLDDVLLLFEAVDIRDPAMDDLSLPGLLYGRVSELSAVDRRDPVLDGCGSSLDGCEPSVCGYDPSLGGWELFVDVRDLVPVDTRDPACDPVLLLLLTTSSRVLLVLLEVSFTDDLLDGRLSLVLLSLYLLFT